ncbi:MAG: hypothetical protein JSV03_03685, partial [Planctomycetota bacterium]
MLTAIFTMILFYTPASDNLDNQTTRIIQSTGIGRFQKGSQSPGVRQIAERSAQIMAARNLLIKLEQIQKNKKTGSKHIIVNEAIRDYRYLPTIYRSDGIAIVTAE